MKVDIQQRKFTHLSVGAAILNSHPKAAPTQSTETTDIVSLRSFCDPTPVASGVVAAMLSINPNLSTKDIKAILCDTASPVAASDAPLVNPEAAIAKARESVPGNVSKNAAIITDGPHAKLTSLGRTSGGEELYQLASGKSASAPILMTFEAPLTETSQTRHQGEFDLDPTPMFTGAAAILLQANPNLSKSELREILQSSVSPGSGLIDLQAAVANATARAK